MTQYDGNLDIVKESEGHKRKKQNNGGGEASSIAQRKSEQTTSKSQLSPHQPIHRVDV